MSQATTLKQCNAKINKLNAAKDKRKREDDINQKQVNERNTLLRTSLLAMYKENDPETISLIQEQLKRFYAYKPNRQWAKNHDISIPK